MTKPRFDLSQMLAYATGDERNPDDDAEIVSVAVPAMIATLNVLRKFLATARPGTWFAAEDAPVMAKLLTEQMGQFKPKAEQAKRRAVR